MTDYPAAFPSGSANVGKSCPSGVGVGAASLRARGGTTSDMLTRGATVWTLPAPHDGSAFALGSREGDTPA